MSNTLNEVRLLLDENISPYIAPQLCDNGIDAVPIRDRAMLRACDHKVLQLAQKESRAVATINEFDFERLVRRMASHCGIAVIPSGGSRDEQFEYILAIAKFWLTSQSAMMAAKNSITTIDGEMRVTSRFAHIAQPTSVIRIPVQHKPYKLADSGRASCSIGRRNEKPQPPRVTLTRNLNLRAR